MQTEEERRVAEEYAVTLSELNTNSKPEINALTMLAEENKAHAVHIAGCIENQLKAAPRERKLPLLYLIDSICKNYPDSRYVELFTQNIVSNFCHVFESSDERVRKSLHKLRMTWDLTKPKTFPPRKLQVIDERVNAMDPNWPILHKTALSTSPQTRSQSQQQQLALRMQEQQPSQLKTQQPQQMQQQQTKNNNNNNKTINETSKRVNNQQQNGRRKRQKASQNNNNNANNNSNNLNQPCESVMVPAPQPFINPNIISTAPDITQVHPTSYMDPSITMVAQTPQTQQPPQTDPLRGPIPAGPFGVDPSNLILTTAAGDPNQAAVGPQTIPILCAPFPTQTPSTTAQIITPPQLITTTATQPGQPTTQHQLITHDNSEAALIQSLLDSLYGPKQCSNCSLRFDDKNNYKKHLDWHFRQNSKTDNTFARRKWYYPSKLWVMFREINDDETEDSNPVTDQTNTAVDPLMIANDLEVHTAPASIDDEKNICSVCHEGFKKFWAEEEEEWRLKDACRHDDDRVCHLKCLPDMQASVGVQ